MQSKFVFKARVWLQDLISILCFYDEGEAGYAVLRALHAVHDEVHEAYQKTSRDNSHRAS